MHRDQTPALELSLGRGGPFYRLVRAARLVYDDREGKLRVARLALVCALGTWAPLVLLGGLGAALGRPVTLLKDFSVHIRLLVAIPCWLFADAVLEARCRWCVRELFSGHLVEPSHRSPLVRATHRAHRLRDSWLAEAILLVASIVAGQLMLQRRSLGLLDDVRAVAQFSAAYIWYGSVALPLVSFLLLRNFWHWGIWLFVLVSTARLDLRLFPLHPDRCGGIKFMERPTDGFLCTAFGSSCIMAAAWATKIVHAHATLGSFLVPFVGLVAVLVLIAFGPLGVFSGKLYRAWHRGLHESAATGTTLARIFERRWLDPVKAPGLIDAGDSSAMIDYTSTFQLVENMRYVPIGIRTLMIFLLVVVFPAVGVVLASVPIQEIFRLIGRVLLGG